MCDCQLAVSLLLLSFLLSAAVGGGEQKVIRWDVLAVSNGTTGTSPVALNHGSYSSSNRCRAEATTLGSTKLRKSGPPARERGSPREAAPRIIHGGFAF